MERFMPPASASSGTNDKHRRSFEYRMSKKVAELTQVVHMLFTRNHEKEVEVEAIKQAYEFEISEIIVDARQRISSLEKQREDTLREQAGDTDRIRKLLEGDLDSKEAAWKRKLEENESVLREERSECQKLRDMLIRAQQDIEKLRQGVSQQETSRAEESARTEDELDRLRRHSLALEQSLNERDKESGDLLQQMQERQDRLERDLTQAHATLEENHAVRDDLLMRNKQLEADMKALKRDFNRKVAEAVNGQKGHRSVLSKGQLEELERLRREVQRYRLELTNRDATFNRMFTDQQPVHLNRAGAGNLKLGLQTSHSAGAVHPGASGSNNPMAFKREKTLSHPPSGPVICFDDQPPQHPAERQRVMSTPSAYIGSRDSRLPSICSTPDNVTTRLHSGGAKTSGQTNRLAKPRPLPKELLFGK